MALARLVEAQQKFSDEALNVARRALRKNTEEVVAEPGFVPAGPWATPSTSKIVSSADPILSVAAASLPRYELAAVGVTWKPPQVRRPGLALASGSIEQIPGSLPPCEPLWNLPVRLPALSALAGNRVGVPASRAIPLTLCSVDAAVGSVIGEFYIHPARLFCAAPRLKTTTSVAIRESEALLQVWNSAPVGIGDTAPVKPVAGLLQVIPVILPRPRVDVAVDCRGALDSIPSFEELESIALAESVAVGTLAPTPAGIPSPTGVEAPLPYSGAAALPYSITGHGGCELDKAAELVCENVWTGLEQTVPESLSAPTPLAPADFSSLIPKSGYMPVAAQLTVTDRAAALSRTEAVETEVVYTPRLDRTEALPAVALPNCRVPAGEAVPVSRAAELLVQLSLSAIAGDEAELVSWAPICATAPDSQAPQLKMHPAGCIPKAVWNLWPLAASFTTRAGAADPSQLSVEHVWPASAPLPARHRAKPVPPAQMDAEAGELSGDTIRNAFAHYRSHVNLRRHWMVAALPLVLGVFWFVNGRATNRTRPDFGEMNSTASTAKSGTFVQASLESVQKNILDRAAIELYDDFRSGLSSWEGSGDWATTWSYDKTGFARTGALALYSPSLDLVNYHLEFLGQIENKGMSWVVRAQDSQNYHVTKLVITRPGPLPSVSLVRYAVINGKEGPRVQTPLPMSVRNDTLYLVRVNVQGPNFTTSVQGQVVDAWTDDRIKRGGVGFFSPKGEQSLLRWITVSHQYDALGRLCAYLAPYSMPTRKGE